jgi:hypothetical protein
MALRKYVWVSRFSEFKRKGPFAVRRIGRRLFWSEPGLYRWLGIVRGRGDCLGNGYDVWLGGYPRSANTFATAAFKLANPGVSVASHFHIPPFIVRGLNLGKPGIFLIRRPIDCVVSWTIYWEGRLRLEQALDYYVDFHRALVQFKSDLFVATFEETTRQFSRVIRKFNQRFGTNYSCLPHDQKSVDRCLSYADDFARSGDGSVNEFTVSRPSEKRAATKAELTSRFHTSAKLAKRLVDANRLYDTFRSNETEATSDHEMSNTSSANDHRESRQRVGISNHVG